MRDEEEEWHPPLDGSNEGLTLLHEALNRLVEDPERLERTYQRLCGSPRYRSRAPSTEFDTPFYPPDGPTVRTNRREEVKKQIDQSRPDAQFHAQKEELAAEITSETLVRTEGSFNSCRIDFGIASCAIMRHWKEQGIWDPAWPERDPGRNWMHEAPRKSSTVSDTNAEDSSVSALNSGDHKPNLTEEQKESKEASRPCHQFTFQVNRERERLQLKWQLGDNPATLQPDINTIAYNNVKERWVKRHIWDERWGILPGMRWRHEEHFETFWKTPSRTPTPTLEDAALRRAWAGGVFHKGFPWHVRLEGSGPYRSPTASADGEHAEESQKVIWPEQFNFYFEPQRPTQFLPADGLLLLSRKKDRVHLHAEEELEAAIMKSVERPEAEEPLRAAGRISPPIKRKRDESIERLESGPAALSNDARCVEIPSMATEVEQGLGDSAMTDDSDPVEISSSEIREEGTETPRRSPRLERKSRTRKTVQFSEPSEQPISKRAKKDKE